MPKKKREEKDVKKIVKKLLDDHGWWWWMPPMNAYAKSGISDFGAVKDGLFMVVETKWHDRELTANQGGYLSSIRQAKHFAFVVRDGLPGSKWDKKGTEYLTAFLGALNRAQAATMRKERVADEDGAMMLNAIREMQQEF